MLVLSTSPHRLLQAQDRAEPSGTHRYLDKPFDLDALLSHIREMLGDA